MNQPADLPTFATDANYPAGTDPWSGTPTKVKPALAVTAPGHMPNTEWPSQWENWWKANVAEHLALAADAAALNWSANTVVDLTQPFTHAKLIQFGERMAGVLNTTLGKTATGGFLSWIPGGGTYGAAGPLTDLVTDHTTILVTDGSLVSKTTNVGDAFSGAGTLANVDANLYHKLGYFNGVWCAMTADKLTFDADLSGTWTNGNAQIPSSWAGIHPREIKSSPNELLILPDTSASKPVIRSTNGSTFSEAGTITSPGAVIASMAYSPAKNQWAAITITGKAFVSGNGGLTWTEAGTITTVSTVTHLVALGSAWVIVCTDRLFTTRDFVTAKKILHVNGVGNWTHALRYTSTFGSQTIERVVVSGNTSNIDVTLSNWLG